MIKSGWANDTLRFVEEGTLRGRLAPRDDALAATVQRALRFAGEPE